MMRGKPFFPVKPRKVGRPRRSSPKRARPTFWLTPEAADPENPVSDGPMGRISPPLRIHRVPMPEIQAQRPRLKRTPLLLRLAVRRIRRLMWGAIKARSKSPSMP